MTSSVEKLFPHEKMRPVQAQMIEDIHEALQNKQHIIMHAPTGIGKTASALIPAIDIAIQKNLTVFFLTSRHTQHHIVIETLKKIKQNKGTSIRVADIIGKKGMCAQDGAESFFSSDFHEYCKKLREDKACDFYQNTRKNPQSLTIQAKHSLDGLRLLIPLHVEETNKEAKKARLCPYEVAIELGKEAQVIITDYYYLFNEGIRTSFLHKIEKELGKAIIIVDEAHNLPERIRNLATHKLSSFILERAITEARKVGKDDLVPLFDNLLMGLKSLLNGQEERKITLQEISNIVKQTHDYDQVVETLLVVGQEIQVESKRSYLLSVGHFLGAWQGEDEGFARILTKLEKGVQLAYRCLDPAQMTKEVFDACYSSIIMSGTLKPTSMYKDILGVSSAIEKEYPNPFPEKNRLTMVIPKTTTKFAQRSEAQYKEIAIWCAGIADEVPGNVALFFPSYSMRDAIYKYFHGLCKRTMFLEKSKQTKEEKKDFIDRFKLYKTAALLGVSTGSFGEGLDMPGVLKGVIIVGLPLQRPDLETQSLIEYYDKRFGKGWDYGYVFPGITRCLQNAGRCIRSETDKGVIVFLDERFAWRSYLNCFPKDWDMVIDPRFQPRMEGFFGKK